MIGVATAEVEMDFSASEKQRNNSVTNTAEVCKKTDTQGKKMAENRSMRVPRRSPVWDIQNTMNGATF